MKLTVVLITLASAAALAAGAGGGHEAGVPKIIFWQVINLAVIFGFVYYKFGKRIAESFKSRNALFLSESEKSKKIQQAAEAKLNDIKHKISRLEETSSESINRARAEAADMKKQLALDAATFADRIKREAQAAAAAEAQSAKRALHEEVVRESVKQAKEILKKDVGQSDQQKLQDQFSTQIEGVRL